MTDERLGVTKDEARRIARARLRSLSGARRARAGERIAELVWSVPEVATARTLLLYASLPEEVPTDEIAREAHRRGVVVTYPRCLPTTRELALHRLSGLHELRSGGYGIREPDPACPLLEVDEIDAALVPGLAWDRAGARLGRGAGYYDRLFARPDFRAFRCGIFFAAQQLPHLPADPWDMPLDAVLTERGLWRAAAAR
ncbi:MAG TPA: 5-formyltetrahydrofolate cyclo-ligase [Longimicrobiaceae bacterium]|nr:5-formyltetrahydrofolate cyclo-ligase [Longimicrobiaceae bacterium]